MLWQGRIYRRFLASTGGIAAVEFSLVFPMILMLLLAGIDGGRAVALSMKVRTATYSLDAMANQYLYIYDTDIQQIFCATSSVLAPYPSGPASVKLTQIKVTAGGQATVSWSDTLNGTAYTQGASISVPSTVSTSAPPNNICRTYPCYVLLAEVNYTYTPWFAHFITGPINLSDQVYIVPRTVTCIQRNGNIPASC
jgi:Flp pilus assembly protein TadG